MKHVLGGMSFPEVLMRSIHAESTCLLQGHQVRILTYRYKKKNLFFSRFVLSIKSLNEKVILSKFWVVYIDRIHLGQLCGYRLLLLRYVRRTYRAKKLPTALKESVVLLTDLVLTEILSKISFEVYSSLQRLTKNQKLMWYRFLQTCWTGEWEHWQGQTFNGHCLQVSPDRRYWTYKAGH